MNTFDEFQVFLTTRRQPFSSLESLPLEMDRRLGICYGDDAVKESCSRLLSARCQVCGQGFPSFARLDQHVRREHQLFHCDICVEHLQVRFRAWIWNKFFFTVCRRQ